MRQSRARRCEGCNGRRLKLPGGAGYACCGPDLGQAGLDLMLTAAVVHLGGDGLGQRLFAHASRCFEMCLVVESLAVGCSTVGWPDLVGLCVYHRALGRAGEWWSHGSESGQWRPRALDPGQAGLDMGLLSGHDGPELYARCARVLAIL
jgi:hypothetical protein